MIALSVIIALVMCSFATVYAFAASSDPANEAEPQKKTYNENFYDELEEMYNYLVSEGEFTGTFEDFKAEVHAKRAALDNLMKYAAENVNPAQFLTDGRSIADLERFFENDFQTGKDINLEEMLEKIKAKNPDISSKLEEFMEKFRPEIPSPLENILAFYSQCIENGIDVSPEVIDFVNRIACSLVNMN